MSEPDEAASRRARWDERYAAAELVWGAEPNRFVAEAFAETPVRGRALDLACGEGRNTIWLAERGWQATGVDFSAVAIERARKLAASRGANVEFVEADVVAWTPKPGAYDLVLLSYLQLPGASFRRVLEHAARALAPGGELFAIGHAVRNLAEGHGGPQDEAVLWEPQALARALAELGLEVTSAEHVERLVSDAPRPAIDARVRARRSTA